MDSFLRGAAYIAASIPLTVLGDLGTGIMMMILFVGEWFYFVLFEVLRKGQTPAKRMMGLRVVRDDGTPVGWNASTLRNLLRFADFLPLGYGFGLISASIHPRFKRLGDLVAGTLVVHTDDSMETAARPTRDTKTDKRPAEWIAPVALEPEERAAILAFTDRAHSWAPERQMELADRLEPLTGATGELGLERTLGMGAWLRGSP